MKCVKVLLWPTALGLVLAAAAGCNGPAGFVPATPPAAVDQVDDLLVQVTPVAVNWDQHPGPDGVDVAVTLYRSSGRLPVTVKGTLEFTLYEGRISADEVAKAKPFRTWRFTGDQLDACRARSAIGWGYAIRLGWGQTPPATSSLTLLPRYTPGRGRAVLHPPITFALRGS